MATGSDTDRGPATQRTPAIAAAAASDQGAWDSLVDRQAQQVWDAAREQGLGPSAATAVCQLAWARLADHLHEVTTDAELRDWLFATVEREARSVPNPDAFS